VAVDVALVVLVLILGSLCVLVLLLVLEVVGLLLV
jgi:hypothetical protein